MLSLLLYLAKKSSLKEYKISTAEMAKDNNFSQQTASRKLIELEELGYIKRIPSTDGISILLTEKAINELSNAHVQLSAMLSKKTANEINGIVTTGLGEGRFYLSIPQYCEQIKDIFGFLPYPGTLNIIVEPSKRRIFLNTKKQYYLHGFKTKERGYGGLKAYSCIITMPNNMFDKNTNNKLLNKNKQNKLKNNKVVEGVVLVPDRTNHDESVIEFVAEKYLRKELNLKDGDEVCLR